MPVPPDRSLLGRIHAGDPGAVVQATWSLLALLNRRAERVGSALREDLLAEGVFAIVRLLYSVEGRRRLQRIENLEAWFHAVLTRIVVRLRIRRRRQATLRLDEAVPSTQKGPPALAENSEIFGILERILQLLDARDREVLERRHLDGESVNTLAVDGSKRAVMEVIRAQERAEREVRRRLALLFPRTWPRIS